MKDYGNEYYGVEMKIKLPWALLGLILFSGCAGKPPEDLGLAGGRFLPCPNSPNCVSTQDDDARHAINPLPFLGTKEESRARILKILAEMKRTTIVKKAENYLHAVCMTALFRFVDDVEFYFDDTNQVVHCRSASRVGYYDFGMNRKRMENIASEYLRE